MLILAASMKHELTGLRRELFDIETATGAHLQVEFQVLGVGPERAGASLTALFERSRPQVDGVLVVGVAGGVGGSKLVLGLWKVLRANRLTIAVKPGED